MTLFPVDQAVPSDKDIDAHGICQHQGGVVAGSISLPIDEAHQVRSHCHKPRVICMVSLEMGAQLFCPAAELA